MQLWSWQHRVLSPSQVSLFRYLLSSLSIPALKNVTLSTFCISKCARSLWPNRTKLMNSGTPLRFSNAILNHVKSVQTPCNYNFSFLLVLRQVTWT
jgi:hypothetical protein